MLHAVKAVISHVFTDKTEKAIMHTPKSLTTSERNYKQVEKEAISIIIAVRKFHKIVFERSFTLLTDHK